MQMSGDGGRIMGLAQVIAATACWATSGIWITWIVEGSQMPAVELAFWRDLSTALCLLAGLALARRQWLRVDRRDLPWLAAMGVFSIGAFHVLWVESVLVNGVAMATVMQSNAPIFVTVAAWLLWREPLVWRKIVAIALAMTGTILIALQGSAQTLLATISWPGLLIGLGSAITIGSYSLLGKRLCSAYHPWTVMAYTFSFAAAALFFARLGAPAPWPVPLPVAAAFAGLLLVPTLAGFSLYTNGLRHLQASVAALVATGEILFAAMIAFAVLGERLTLWQVVGACLVAAGVVLVSMPASNRWRWPWRPPVR